MLAPAPSAWMPRQAISRKQSNHPLQARWSSLTQTPYFPHLQVQVLHSM